MDQLVRVVKLSLLHVIKDRILTDFQMMTVFTEVENIVNNMPLTANSDKVKDVEALSPNYFLIGRNFCNNNHLGETRASDLCSRKRWRKVQLLTQHFWSCWLKEHLPTLTRRVKWQSDCPNVKVGELVLLRDDTVRRGLQPLGRIENIHTGGDGIVRVIDVRT